MTPELTALATAVLVQICALCAYSVVGNRELGPRITLSSRENVPPLSPLLGRLQRAMNNGFEGLAMFTPAVLVVALSGTASPVTTFAAWAYVAARIAYVPAYALNLPPWRSLIWTIGFLATLTLLLTAILAGAR